MLGTHEWNVKMTDADFVAVCMIVNTSNYCKQLAQVRVLQSYGARNTVKLQLEIVACYVKLQLELVAWYLSCS